MSVVAKSVSQPKKVPPERIIPNLPNCYNTQAQIHESNCFDPDVQHLCSSETVHSIRIKMCKMILIGDVSVGKTSLVSRFGLEQFHNSYTATIGIDFVALRFDILNLPFTLHVWDTAGQERFQSIAGAYYKGAHVVTIVFDLSDRKSLVSAERWLESAKKENKEVKNLLVFLVGTKNDLVSTYECNKTESDAIKIAQRMNAEFWNVSAKTGKNVKEFFCRVAALAFEHSIKRELKRRENCQKQEESNIKLRKVPQQNDSTIFCCKDQ